MKSQLSVTRKGVFNMAVIGLAVLTVASVTPRLAAAQGDAIRIMAGRVLGQVGRDRGDETWGNGELARRDSDRLRRERREREQWCARHRGNKKCDAYGFENRRGGDWCLDRDRNGRCDVNRRDERSNRGRGPWFEREDERYGGRRGR